MSESTLRGVGVVIDDHISSTSTADEIVTISRELEKSGIPLVKYEKLPAESVIANLGSVAFVLLDWDLGSTRRTKLPTGVRAGRGMEASQETQNANFIKTLQAEYTFPIFIFSNQGLTDIKGVLGRAGIDFSDGSGIFIHAKSSLTGTASGTSKLFQAIDKWYEKNPSAYVLSRWRARVETAQNQMFKDFHKENQMWPLPLWKTYADDKDDPDRGISELLFKNFQGRFSKIGLEGSKLSKSIPSGEYRDSLRKILSLSIVIPETSLEGQAWGCGDLLKKGSNYTLLISCDCDFINHDGGEDPKVLRIDGDKVTETALANCDRGIYLPEYGKLNRPMHCAYVFPAVGGKCFQFNFGSACMETVESIKALGYKRVGRITSPYITDIRQRYSQWVQREGFPRVPALLIKE